MKTGILFTVLITATIITIVAVFTTTIPAPVVPAGCVILATAYLWLLINHIDQRDSARAAKNELERYIP